MLNKIFKQFSSTQLIFGKKARESIIKGVEILNKATSCTLGPKGRNVCIENELRLPRITKDGVTVAKNIMLKDNLNELGASLVRQASSSTNQFAGDGTTTTIILTNSILEEGQKFVNFDLNPIEIKRGMDKAKKCILEYLEEVSIKIKTKEQLKQVGMVCTNFDENMSELISEALWEIGLDGLIEIEPGNSLQNQLIISSGINLNRGYASRELIVNKSTNKIELNYPIILTADFQINKIKQIVPSLEIAKKYNKPLLILAKDITNEVISNLIFNTQKKIINCCAITIPGMGNYSRTILDDISLLTGSKLFEELNYDQFVNLNINSFGKCSKVQISEQHTLFQAGYGSQLKIEQRIQEIKREIKQTMQENSLKILKDRLSRLTGRMAIILCGGNTEFDIFENRDRLVDGLNGVKNALKYGILPGGGVCLLNAVKLLEFVEVENFDQQCGVNILKKALLKPTITLLENAGLNGSFIAQNIIEKQQNDPYIGYDLNKNQYVNFIENGIFDSLVVVKATIEDSISTASMILTTEVAIIKDKKYIAPSLKTYRKQMF